MDLSGPERTHGLAGKGAGPLRLASSVGLPQHPDQHRPQGPVLLAVDQQLGEGAALRVAPELADAVRSLEVGEHQDVEQFSAGSGAEGVQSLLESAFELIRSHC
jgi:hypothetical protein